MISPVITPADVAAAIAAHEPAALVITPTPLHVAFAVLPMTGGHMFYSRRGRLDADEVSPCCVHLVSRDDVLQEQAWRLCKVPPWGAA